LLGIAQCGDYVHYLNWVSSESGPLVTDFKSQFIKGGIDYTNPENIKQIFESGVKSVKNETHVSFSIDTKFLNLYQIRTNFDEHDNQLIDWNNSQQIDKNSNSLCTSFQYPMHPESKSILGISIQDAVRNNLTTIASQFNCKIVALSSGIFSAEQGVRQWFHTKQFNSHIVWKIGKHNIDQLVLVKKDEIVAFLEIRRTKENIKLRRVIGSQNDANNIINQINDVINTDKSKFTCAEKVFVYQSDKRQKEVRGLMDLIIENLVLLNPFTVLEMDVDKKCNEFSSLPFAETGVAFRGIDV